MKGFSQFNKNWDGVVRKGITEATASKEIKVGDIFYSEWGYEQTNINFYKVTKLVGTQTLELRQLETIRKSDGPQTMTGTATPGTNFIGPPIRKRLSTRLMGQMASYGMGQPIIKIESYEFAKLWDGKPKQYSSYH